MAGTRSGSGMEAVAPVETAARGDTERTPAPTRKATRRSKRAKATPANIGQGSKKPCASTPENRRGEAVEGVGKARTAPAPPRGDSDSRIGPSPIQRKFPTADPKKITIVNLDESKGKHEDGYDSDGHLPFFYDYEGCDSDDEAFDPEDGEGEEEGEEGGEAGAGARDDGRAADLG